MVPNVPQQYFLVEQDYSSMSFSEISVVFLMTTLILCYLFNGGVLKRLFGSLAISGGPVLIIMYNSMKKEKLAYELKQIEKIKLQLTTIASITFGAALLVTYLTIRNGFTKMTLIGLGTIGGLTRTYITTKHELEMIVIQTETLTVYRYDYIVLVCTIAALIYKLMRPQTSGTDWVSAPSPTVLARMLNEERNREIYTFNTIFDDIIVSTSDEEGSSPRLSYFGAYLNQGEQRFDSEDEYTGTDISRTVIKHNPVLNISNIAFHQRSLNEDECPICCDPLKASDQKQQQQIIMLGCGHPFHEQCIVHWLRQKDECPICRKKFPEIVNVTENCFHQDVNERRRKKRQRRKKAKETSCYLTPTGSL